MFRTNVPRDAAKIPIKDIPNALHISARPPRHPAQRLHPRLSSACCDISRRYISILWVFFLLLERIGGAIPIILRSWVPPYVPTCGFWSLPRTPCPPCPLSQMHHLDSFGLSVSLSTMKGLGNSILHSTITESWFHSATRSGSSAN